MTEFPRYIQDKPNGIDKFEGASQEALSDAIVSHIKDNDLRSEHDEKEALPRIIGIEGGWGSGKSNVVKMIENKLSESYFSFEYDAWGNQEDLQRRSLLEQLTSELVKNEVLVGKASMPIRGDVVKDKSWEELLKLLLSHKTEKTTRSIPKLNSGIVSAVLVAIATPITSTIASSLSDDDSLEIRILLATAPIIIALVVWIYCIIKSWWKLPNPKNLKGMNRWKEWKKQNKYLSWSFFTTIYAEKDITTHDYEVISEEEPTVVDFKNWMEQISNSLNPEICKKLLIVFDNMDRLPAEKVKQLWSSIHTFFAETGFKNIWIIIPYDETHLSCAFGDGDNCNSKELTRYFVQKTFPVTFSVSAPVITDYKGIFNKLFEEAFGNTQKEEQEIVNRLYRLSRKNPNVREIIIFINKLVATHATRKKDVRLRNMAIYILHKDDIEHDSKRSASEVILSGDYLGDASNFIENDTDFKSEIAALTYGVNKQMASQIPMTEYIENCFDKADGYDINNYAADENFIVILKEICENIDSAKLSKTIEVLNGLSVTNSDIDTIWKELAKRQLKESVSKLELSNVYKILLSHVQGPLKDNISKKLCTQWINIESFKGDEYINCVNELAIFFTGIQELPLIDKMVDAKTYVDAVTVVLDDVDCYHLICDLNDVDSYLAEDVSEKFTAYKVVESLKRTKKYNFELVHNAIKKAIKEKKLSANNVGQLCQTNRCLYGFKDFIFDYDLRLTRTIIEELESNNKTTLNDGYIDMLAFALSQDSTQSIPDENVTDVSSLIEWYNNKEDIISKAVNHSNNDIAKVAIYILKNKNSAFCDIVKILPLYNNIINNLGLSGKEVLEFLDRFDYTEELTKLTETTSNFKNNIPENNIFQETRKEETDFAKSLNKLTISMIVKDFTADELKTKLSNYKPDYWNGIIETLLDVEQINQANNLLKDLAELLIKDVPSYAPKIKASEYTKRIINTYSLHGLKHVFSELRNNYCNGNVQISKDAFILLETGFREYNVYDGSSIDDCIDFIIKPVIGDDSCKTILLDNAKYYKKLVAKSSNVDDFEKKLIEKWDDDEAFKILSKRKEIPKEE